MATLLYSATASLDGFIAGPGGDMSWLTPHLAAPNPTADRLLSRVGALLVGARTFGGDDPNRGTEQEGAFGGQWSGPVVLLTHRPAGRTADGVTATDDLHHAVDLAREAAGDGVVDVLGADVARQLLDARLLDEVLLFFAPVLLGDGVRVFDHPGGTQVLLDRVPGETEHWYRVRYPPA
ncbi:Dihydrofolate reductase [Geodermatophilus telluris]|uniref:Dihydrofolate reductase n=1 Tax=Geodermatophilus telluris TaxID=1190417 RepID=A0A1G6ICD5_9ACTN|nr:dihydrofolate reductase family protein [Geodermatophilus telluris]SDC04202.1 Dihydrofolate reductase [Geodermatophilus telluris]